MNNNTTDKTKNELEVQKENQITRGDAIKKGAFIAMSAATMMILLSSPKKAQAASPAAPPAW